MQIRVLVVLAEVFVFCGRGSVIPARVCVCVCVCVRACVCVCVRARGGMTDRSAAPNPPAETWIGATAGAPSPGWAGGIWSGPSQDIRCRYCPLFVSRLEMHKKVWGLRFLICVQI